MEGLRFRVLGPTEVRHDGSVLALPAKRLRVLLTELLINANRVVPPGQLIQASWAGEPPAGPERALHTSVSRLRAALGPVGDLIRTVPGGYLIELEPDQLDLAKFRALVERAGAADDPRQQAHLLGEALDLWQDVPLTGLGTESLEGRPWLIEERLQAIERLVDARLAIGDHSAVVAELTGLTREHPLRERFWSQLMLALYRGGRQADALAAYRRLAALLAEELGVDPGTEVRQLHQAILTGDVPTQTPATDPIEEPADNWARHAQLPMDLSDFVGRSEVITEITERLSETSAMPVVTISGAPGVGKSALAVHLGHRLRGRFPDGQWHVRLAGAGNSPREPLEVLGELLSLAGVDPHDLPADLDRRAALLRSTLADRRVLLLLDDARDARQVKPLLPGTAGNAVLVTSRNELAGLSVSVGARGTRLTMLDPAEALDLLAGMLGAERVAAEPSAAAELAEVCDRLPLALRIAAGLLSGRPDQSIAGYVEELRAGDRLAGLAIGDEPDTAVAATFALSYEALQPQARRLFALLGVVPGGDLSVPGAAALFDGSPREVGPLLETLAAGNLLQRERSRYRMHDLIRLYAAGRAEVEPGADAAWQRLIDWYLRTTDAATDFEYSPLVRLTERVFDENPFTDAAQAGAWLEAEEQNLVACVSKAADSGPYGVAWRLADVLRHYFSINDRVGPWRQAATAGLRAARAAGDRDGEGAMRHSLGALAFTVGEVEVAITESAAACEAYAEAGFGLGEAALLCNLGMAYDDHGESVQAAEFLMRGIRAFRALGRIGSLWPALHSLSNVSHNLGDLDAAVAAASEALEIAPDGYAGVVGLLNRGAAYRLLGQWDRAEADMTTALAMEERPSAPGQYETALLYADLGRYDEAMAHAEAGVTISHRDGLEFHEASALNVLGIIRGRQGRWDEAARHHAEARDIAVRLGHRAREAEALLGLAAVALARKELAEAFDLGQQARELAGQLRQRIVECRALLLLAEAGRQAGRADDAERWAAEAATIQAGTGYRPPVAVNR
ncbi:DNA-binding SARP family transcriptional activator [Kribbella voronezhensis]|uniref:DNA-binding SARP family transcriptional activator n=1 Tax=Kribbella voronezhensis TaxID=2512212 RepID=A0A4R7T6C5_9ACTN|nr:BTAD domain-containing putative transcriptional regulator [Kribbella voronezhensis]TDU86806.1 DNA-binding SARP family transcriptional activator [Kribbella voronezhensis]